MSLSTSHSQPHLSLAARHAHTPLQPSDSAKDLAYFSGPTQKLHAAGAPGPRRGLQHSSSAATIGSIAEEEPYSFEAAKAWCGACSQKALW